MLGGLTPSSTRTPLHCLPLSLSFPLSRLRSAPRCRRGRLASFVRPSEFPLNYQNIELKGFEKFTHFSPLFFVLLFPAMGIILPIFNPGGRDMTLFWVIGLPITIPIYLWLKRLLRYQVVHTQHGSSENYSSVRALAHERGWIIKSDRPYEFIQAAVPGFPKTMASWGELVTVAFLGGDCYINSICNPDQHPSIIAYGRNLENVEAVKSAVIGPNP